MAQRVAPEITLDERKQALAKATEVRRARAELKAKISTGEVPFSDVLDPARKDDILIGRMRVKELLRTQHGVGPKRAEQIMEELKIPAYRRIGGLNDNMRGILNQYAQKHFQSQK